MSKNMIVTWPELGISVELEPNADGSNRWIYDFYYDHLPFEYQQVHSLLTGDVFYTFFDIGDTLPVANDTDHILVHTQIDDPDNVGNIHLSYNIPNGLSGGNIAHIGMFYGPCFEDMPGYISAHCVKEDLPKLIEAGNKIAMECYRGKKPITAIWTRKED